MKIIREKRGDRKKARELKMKIEAAKIAQIVD